MVAKFHRCVEEPAPEPCSTDAEEVLDDEKFEAFVVAGGDEFLLRGAIERPHFFDEMLKNLAALP